MARQLKRFAHGCVSVGLRFKPYGEFHYLSDQSPSTIIYCLLSLLDSDWVVSDYAYRHQIFASQHAAKCRTNAGAAVADHTDFVVVSYPFRLGALDGQVLQQF